MPRWGKKKKAQMKEQIKAPKIELNDKEIANQSDKEFKTLVSGYSQKWLSMVAK